MSLPDDLNLGSSLRRSTPLTKMQFRYQIPGKMGSQSELFSNIYKFLDRGYDARGSSYQYPFHLLNQKIGYPGSSDAGKGFSGTGIYDKPWSRPSVPGQEWSYPKYSPTGGGRRTLQQELASMVPHYKTYRPYQITSEPPMPNPAIPQFRNEFADIQIEPVRRPYIPPPPARTTGLKPYSKVQKGCKFCIKNGEHAGKFMTHTLFDNDNQLSCPILATFTCATCNQKGHTRSYCTAGETGSAGTAVVRLLSEHNKSSGPASH